MKFRIIWKSCTTKFTSWHALLLICLFGISVNTFRNSFQFFLIPVATEFGSSRSVVATATGVFMVVSGIGGILSGWLIDRYLPKKVLMMGSILLIVSLSIIYFSPHVILFIFGYGFVGGIGYALCWGVPTQIYVTQWFKNYRGLALSILSNCNSLGLVLFAPLWSVASTSGSWRVSYLLLLFTLLIILPTLLLLMRSPKSNQKVSSQSTKVVSSVGWFHTFKSSIKNKAILFSFAAVLTCGFTMGIMDAHIVPMMHDHNYSSDKIGKVMSLFGVTVIIGGLISGWVSDKLQNRKLVLTSLYIVRAIGFLILILPIGSIKFILFILVFGISYSGVVPLSSANISENSLKNGLGKLLSLNLLIHQTSGLFGVYIGGLSYDLTGGYNIVIFAALIMCRLFISTGIIGLKRSKHKTQWNVPNAINK